jgi:hypothetical protein
MHVTKSGAGANIIGIISSLNVQYCGTNPVYSSSTTANGIEVTDGSLVGTNLGIFSTTGNALSVSGSSVNNNFTNIRIDGAGSGATPPYIYGIYAATGFNIFNTIYSTGGIYLSGNQNALTSSRISLNSGTIDSVYVAAGTDVTVGQNTLLQSGAATALKTAGGVTMTDSINNITGSVSLSHTRTSNSTFMNPYVSYPSGALVHSANTIVSTGDRFHVDGTATIKTLTGLAGQGRVCLVADAAWQMDATGNFAAALGPVTANNAYCFVSIGGFWFHAN